MLGCPWSNRPQASQPRAGRGLPWVVSRPCTRPTTLAWDPSRRRSLGVISGDWQFSCGLGREPLIGQTSRESSLSVGEVRQVSEWGQGCLRTSTAGGSEQ